MGEHSVEEFIEFFKETFNTRVKFSEVILTLPDMKNDKPVKDTGGRSDIFFYVHVDDIPKFAVPRLDYGISWWEDIIMNGRAVVYSQEIIDKYPKTW